MNKDQASAEVIGFQSYADFVNGLFVLPNDPQQKHQVVQLNLSFDFGAVGQLRFEELRIKPSTTIADILQQHHLLVGGQVEEAKPLQELARRVDVANIEYRGNTYIVSLMSDDEILVQKANGDLLKPSPTHNAVVKRYRDTINR